MREILFRGKAVGNDIWVYGISIATHIGVFISYEENPHYCGQYGYMEIDEIVRVESDSVGQYTGFTDHNGNKIFEGDIIAYLDATSTESGYIERGCVGEVFWDVETASFQVTGRLSCESCEAMDDECLVIGNIYDNRELMEGRTK